MWYVIVEVSATPKVCNAGMTPGIISEKTFYFLNSAFLIWNQQWLIFHVRAMVAESIWLATPAVCTFLAFYIKDKHLMSPVGNSSASIVTMPHGTGQRSEPNTKGRPDKTKQYNAAQCIEGISCVLVGVFCRGTFRGLNSLRSLLSQEVCLARSLGDDVWTDSKSTGLITLTKYSGKYSALTHMRSINHLYNACHIKCYYDCGLKSVSAVLNLARFQKYLVALHPPPPAPRLNQLPPSIYLWGPYMPSGACLNASLPSGSCAPSLSWTLTCTSWVGAKDRFTEFFAVTFPKPSAELRVRVVGLIKQHCTAVRTTLCYNDGIIPSNRPAES